MPISGKLRLAYVAEWLLAVSVSAVPVEHLPVVAEGDSSMVVMHEKREENSESLKKALNDAVRLDHEIANHSRKGEGDPENNGDSDESSVGEGPKGKHGDTPSHPGPSGEAGPVRLEGPSTAAKNFVIAGGAIAAFVLVAAAAFWLYKTNGKAFRRANFKYWKCGSAHRPRCRDTVYDEKPPRYPHSTISRPGMERKYSTPGMPFPPPPAALAPSDTSLERRQSRKPLLIRTSLLPKNKPVSPPSPIDQKGTFYDGASDVDSPSSSSSRQQEQPPLPPPAYMSDHPLLSPSQSSSISNIKPRDTTATTTTNNRQPSYTKMYPPPLIPKSNTTPRGVAPMDSRFSWTTATASEAPSAAKSVCSVDSEPRFRGVNSWVSHQAGRLERSERSAQSQLEQQQQVRGVQLTHHPSAPMSFLADQSPRE